MARRYAETAPIAANRVTVDRTYGRVDASAEARSPQSCPELSAPYVPATFRGGKAICEQKHDESAVGREARTSSARDADGGGP